MRESHFEDLRAYAGTAVRQPEFADIRRRAGRKRRRRAIASSAAAVVAVLVVTGLGYAATADRRGGAQVAHPVPATEDGWPRVTSVVATGPAELYLVREQCRECGPELFASHDAGATWQSRPVPPASEDGIDPRISSITALGGGILTWQDAGIVTREELQGLPSMTPAGETGGKRGPLLNERLWITVDGGRTWRRPGFDPQPMAAVPAGTRPVDCGLVGPVSPCLVYAVNPVSGRFARLADQPSGIAIEWGDTRALIGGRLWVPGLDPVTRKPAVASSPDSGRTWRTHVFTDAVAGVADDEGRIAGMYLPIVAAGKNGTAYVVTYRDEAHQATYRTTDGGATWKAGAAVPEIAGAGLVTADGVHVVTTGEGSLASRDGGDYEPVTLPGYFTGAQLRNTNPWQPTTGRYLALETLDLLLSDDGWTWRRVRTP
jgi:hypothetical protein